MNLPTPIVKNNKRKTIVRIRNNKQTSLVYYFTFIISSFPNQTCIRLNWSAKGINKRKPRKTRWLAWDNRGTWIDSRKRTVRLCSYGRILYRTVRYLYVRYCTFVFLLCEGWFFESYFRGINNTRLIFTYLVRTVRLTFVYYLISYAKFGLSTVPYRYNTAELHKASVPSNYIQIILVFYWTAQYAVWYGGSNYFCQKFEPAFERTTLPRIWGPGLYGTVRYRTVP